MTAIATARPALQILDMVNHLAAMFALVRTFIAPAHIVQFPLFKTKIAGRFGGGEIRTL